METFRYVTSQIRQYISDVEIINFIKSNRNLADVYAVLEDATGKAVIPLVSLENEVKHTFNLQVIVKHEQRLTYGFYEYFLVKDFVNKKTNLYMLFELLCISTGAELDDLVNNVHWQLTELGVTINQ